MAGIPNVYLSLSSRPENVLVVRQALSGVADVIGLDAVEANDLKTAVSEACNNVVLHAYGREEGLLEVELRSREGMIEVVVRDHGGGIDPRADAEAPRTTGIGLHVIQALSHSVEFGDLEGGGTEVRMEFGEPAEGTLTAPIEDDVEMPAVSTDELANTVEMALAPHELARSVLPRVLMVLAARAYFSTDRLPDIEQVADSLVSHSRNSISGSHLGFNIKLAPRNLQLSIGPLRIGEASRVMSEAAADGLGPVIDRVADEHRVVLSHSAEMLALTLIDRSSALGPAAELSGN